MSELMLNKIRRDIFDQIEDNNDLSQEHRIWLLDIIESNTATMYIRECLRRNNELDEHSEVSQNNCENIVEYVFENFIK